ncbi:MAG: hypothetical protein V4850_25590 [Myxococcota bacterium]
MRRALVVLVVTAVILGCSSFFPPTSGPEEQPPALTQAELSACLDDDGSRGESGSPLWRDLANWAFAQVPEIPSSDVITHAQAEALLDAAAREVSGLETPEQWRSAARYFQAENFHGLEVPACRRAKRIDPE